MKKNYVIFFAIVWLILGISNASGQTGNDAVKALKKIEAKLAYELSYKDYIESLSQAKVEVDLFLDSKEAQKNPQMASLIKKVFINYNNVLKVWEHGQLNSNAAFKNNQEAIESMQNIILMMDPTRRRDIEKQRRQSETDTEKRKNFKDFLNPKSDSDYKLLLELRKSYPEIKQLDFNKPIYTTDINKIIIQESTKDLKKASYLLTQ